MKKDVIKRDIRHRQSGALTDDGVGVDKGRHQNVGAGEIEDEHVLDVGDALEEGDRCEDEDIAGRADDGQRADDQRIEDDGTRRRLQQVRSGSAAVQHCRELHDLRCACWAASRVGPRRPPLLAVRCARCVAPPYSSTTSGGGNGQQ